MGVEVWIRVGVVGGEGGSGSFRRDIFRELVFGVSFVWVSVLGGGVVYLLFIL